MCFADSPLFSGYNTVLEIPVGARNIFIRDLGENRNPLGNNPICPSLRENTAPRL